MEAIQRSITDERTQKICGASIQHDISQKKNEVLAPAQQR
jgi:hypothetical protein